jgi:hypothetical protein
MRPDDGGSSRPPLPEQAGPTERTLYDVYDFQTGIVDLTAADWATSAESVRGLSADVRGIVRALRGAPDAWDGPAAEAAYQTLGKLADNLDVHAADIDRIEAGLKSAYDSVAVARTDYVTTVRSVSLDLDPGDYQRTPVRQPAQAEPDLSTVLDRAAYDQAVAGARAAREQQAAAVLATFTDSMTTATKKLPVEPAQREPVRDGSTGGTGGTGGSGGGGTGPGGTPYAPVGSGGGSGGGGGGGGNATGHATLPPTDGGGCDAADTDDPPRPLPEPGPQPEPGPWPPVTDPPPPPVLDGLVDGTTSPGARGGALPAPGSTATGAGGASASVGAGGTAAGMGGVLAGGGAAALMGRRGMPGGAAAGRLPGGAAAGRLPGSMVATSSGGGVAGRGAGAGSSAAARSSVVAGGGGQGGAARGATGGRGAARTGRYGVPKLGGGAAGRGGPAVVGGGAAGGRGRAEDRKDPQDVDHLTSEDEETWFEGAEDATAPVWE